MESQDYLSKAQETFSKNKELINQKKYYQFGQKIKLISHRKIQGKRYQQAQQILIVAADNIYNIAEVQDNICYELLQQLVQLYKSNPQLLVPDSEKKIVSIIKKRQISVKEISLLTQLVRKIGRPEKSRIISEQIVKFRVSRKQFATVEKIAAGLSEEIAINFVHEWTQHEDVKEEEIPAIWARMVLCRGVTFHTSESKKVLNHVPNKYSNSAYINFAKLLIQVCQIKSQEAYSLIEKSYSQFLQRDYIFKGLYNSFGVMYLNKKIESGGLMGLLGA